MTKSQKRDIREKRRELERRYSDCYERYTCMYEKADSTTREVIFELWYGGVSFKPLAQCKDENEIESMIDIMNFKLSTIRSLL